MPATTSSTKATGAPIDAFISAVHTRRSITKLTNTSPIPDWRIKQLVAMTLKHAPSPFFVQSARAVVLIGEEHEKLWDIGDALTKASVPEPVYKSFLGPKIQGYRAGYGSVLWFEDESALDELRQKHENLKHVITEWSDHSSGMHEFIAWTALELEGLGCNLQHYNFNPAFTAEVRKTWNLPDSWVLKSQLVFGTPTGGPDKVKEFAPVFDTRLRSYGGSGN